MTELQKEVRLGFGFRACEEIAVGSALRRTYHGPAKAGHYVRTVTVRLPPSRAKRASASLLLQFCNPAILQFQGL
jgi:hypothetical protein